MFKVIATDYSGRKDILGLSSYYISPRFLNSPADFNSENPKRGLRGTVCHAEKLRGVWNDSQYPKINILYDTIRYPPVIGRDDHNYYVKINNLLGVCIYAREGYE
jgi:hypothetical protein